MRELLGVRLSKVCAVKEELAVVGSPPGAVGGGPGYLCACQPLMGLSKSSLAWQGDGFVHA